MVSAVQDGKPLVLDVVKKAEQRIINDPQQNKVTSDGTASQPCPLGTLNLGMWC